MVSCPRRYKLPQQNLINNLHALAVIELPHNETDSLGSATPQATVVAGSAPPVTLLKIRCYSSTFWGVHKNI